MMQAAAFTSRRKGARFTKIFVFVAACSMLALANAQDAPTFNWSSIEPAQKLSWVPCYTKLECARLSVPLDYQNPDPGEITAVALVRQPALAPRNDTKYLGPILFNPGGPRESGVDFIVSTGDFFRTTLGEGFDLIGFDPRGVGHTTPQFGVFSSSGEAGLFSQKAYTVVNASDVALGSLYTTAQSLGQLALARAGKIGQYIGTAAVARDMLSIINALGGTKLQYWGFSYGTVLGETFAAMFPDNVGRLVLDGVVDADEYYAALWSNDLVDSEAALLKIYDDCVKAGPSICPIYEDSAPKIQSRVDSLLAKIKETPLQFYNATTSAFGQVDYSSIKTIMLQTLYSPAFSGKNLLFALADLEKGEPQAMYTLSGQDKLDALVTQSGNCSALPKGQPYVVGPELTIAVACSDGDPVEDSVQELRVFYDKMAEQSTFAESWFIHWGCSGWKIRAKERFTGPFVANTSHPILFVGNTADPVTPLRNAHKMAKGFNGSVVLTQKAAGHSSLAAPSLCAMTAVKQYFTNGALPTEGTVCDQPFGVFDDSSVNSTDHNTTLSKRDGDILRAARELQKHHLVPRFW